MKNWHRALIVFIFLALFIMALIFLPKIAPRFFASACYFGVMLGSFMICGMITGAIVGNGQSQGWVD